MIFYFGQNFSSNLNDDSFHLNTMQFLHKKEAVSPYVLNSLLMDSVVFGAWTFGGSMQDI